MKTVFTGSELPHIWARQSQSEGRTSNRNFYFVRGHIYSYGSHFCIANIISPGIVLFTNRRYSVSTSAHTSAVEYACNHMEKVIVAYPEGSLTDNLKAFSNEIQSLLDILANPRKKAETKERAKGDLSNIVSRINRYLDVTGQTISKKLPYNDEVRKDFILYVNAAKSEQAAKSLSLKLERREKEKQKEIERKKAEALKEQQHTLLKWRRGANVPTHQFSGVDKVYLRAKNNEIETSKGARISLGSGHALYKAIHSGRDVKGYDLDGYTVISLNGVLKVGCHEIERTEIERFAKRQGWKIS